MATDLIRSLEAAGIRFVRIAWCDNANVRGKAVHVGLRPHGVGISTDALKGTEHLDAVRQLLERS